MYGPNVSVNTAVATLVDGHRVTIDTLETEALRIDGQVMTISSGDSVTLGGGQIHYDAGVYSIVFPTQERLIVTDRGSYVDVRLCASADRPDGSLHGLLGNFDGNAANDLATRNGTVLPTHPTFAQLYDTFTNSWRITQAESLFDYRAGESTASFSGENCPIQTTTRASLPADKVAEAIALLDAAGITDPALREAAILDYALTCDPSFINSAGQAGVPSESVKVIDPTIIWTNGGQVIIGSPDSPSQFDIGTSASTPAGVNWTGAAASDNWSESGNWSPNAPASTDALIFDAIDADGTSIVDQGFAIAALLYTGEVATGTGAADHITDFDEDSTLTVSGNATIGANNSQSPVNLTIANGTAVVAHVTGLNVGINSAGSGSITGNLTVTSGASLDASDADELSVGRVTNDGWQAQANGTLVLGADSLIDLGALAGPATLNIGWNESTSDSGFNQYLNHSSATGLLDATNGALNAELSELNVGMTSWRGTANGTLIMGDDTTINTLTANIGVGTGATGTLTLLDNFAGTFAATTTSLANGLFDFGNNTLAVGGSGSIATGTFNLSGGLLSGSSVNLTAGGSFDFTGGRLDVTAFTGSLNEVGGTLAAGDTAVGKMTVNGDYGLSAAGTLEINLAGYGAGTGYDQLAVNGAVDLDGSGAVGGMLDLVLDFAAQLNDRFVIIDNDGADAIAGTFFGLAEGDSLQKELGDQLYSFAISYAGGDDGNDVELTVTSVVASPTPLAMTTFSASSSLENSVMSTDLGDMLVVTQLVADADAAQGAPAAQALDTLDAEAGETPLDGMHTASFSEIVRFDTRLDALSDLGGGTQDPFVTSSAEIGAQIDPWPIFLASSGATADAIDAVEFSFPASDGILDFYAAASAPADFSAVPPPEFATALLLGNVDFVLI
jgi:hypothetical protein